MGKPMSKQTEELRQTYLENRNAILEDFAADLEEVQRESPSVDGKIAGMDFQQFRAYAIFAAIIDQEEYIDYARRFNLLYVNPTEEQTILNKMIAQAKGVFGDQYEEWYNSVKEER
jgi:hypothetical protein